MIIEHEGKRYEVSFIDYLYGEPGPFGVNSVLHVLRELPAETTITRDKLKAGMRVWYGPISNGAGAWLVCFEGGGPGEGWSICYCDAVTYPRLERGRPLDG